MTMTNLKVRVKMITMKLKKTISLTLLLIMAGIFAADALENDVFPPFYIRKVNMGDQFVPFNLVDLDGKTWSNKTYMRKPLLIITGSWPLRHDLRKWANFLSMQYLTTTDVLWVFNPGGTLFADHRRSAEQAFTEFKTSVPVAIDVHSYIGRSLKIDYDIPTIIGIDRLNRFRFCMASPFNKPGAEELKALIKNRL